MMRTRFYSPHVLLAAVLSVALELPAHAVNHVHVEGFGERGLEINCVTAGRPSEADDLPVAILLHGFGGSSFSFRGILETPLTRRELDCDVVSKAIAGAMSTSPATRSGLASAAATATSAPAE